MNKFKLVITALRTWLRMTLKNFEQLPNNLNLNQLQKIYHNIKAFVNYDYMEPHEWIATLYQLTNPTDEKRLLHFIYYSKHNINIKPLFLILTIDKNNKTIEILKTNLSHNLQWTSKQKNDLLNKVKKYWKKYKIKNIIIPITYATIPILWNKFKNFSTFKYYDDIFIFQKRSSKTTTLPSQQDEFEKNKIAIEKYNNKLIYDLINFATYFKNTC